MRLRVNGGDVAIRSHPTRRLSEVLREELELRGTKSGCNAGDCGACTVLIDGKAMCSCLIPVAQAEQASIVTVEGLSQKPQPGTAGDPVTLSALQKSMLRHGAAQCGICTPGMLMAACALLEKDSTLTRSQIEDGLSGVLCRCTGYNKIITAILDVASPGASLPLPACGNTVGARIERLDGLEKITGKELFGADHVPANSLLVRAIRSPHAKAEFTFGDLQKWKTESAGIEAVVTAADIKGDNCFGVIPAYADQPALAVNQTLFRGEAIALVVGDENIVSELDLDDFPVTWNQQNHCISIEEALSANASQVHDNFKNNILIEGKVVCGDAGAALDEVAQIAQMEFETTFVEHAYIEPEAGSAWLDGDVLVIQACTQAPVMDRDSTAVILGLESEKVRVIPSATGGGFGSKLDLSLQPLLGLAVLKTGKPCRMIYSRGESMASTTKRHPAKMQAKIGCDVCGQIVAMQFSGDFNTGAYASWGPTVTGRVPVHASGPYLTPNYDARVRAVYTNAPPSGAFRGFGVPQAAIIQEILFDDLAIQSNIDRLKFRQINALADGDRTVCGQTPKGIGIGDCLDALEERWQTATLSAAEFNSHSPTIKKGVGVASCWYGCGNTAIPNPSTIRLGISSDGKLFIHQGAVDIGQGSNTVIPQICADALGVEIGKFELVGADTALTPDCGKTSGSRQTFVTGKAAELAGLALRKQILRMSNMGDSATISLEDQKLVIRDSKSAHSVGLVDLEPDENGYVIAVEETYDPPTTALDENGQGVPYAVYGYGAHIAEIEVDTVLGTLRITDITAAHDVGRAINPLLCEGQIEGGIAQGLGMTLMEEFIPGQTENLHDYLIPTIGDMPRIKSILVEKTDPEGPMGAKGLGEHVLIPTAPAILNAIRDACGARITTLPALPHRVLKAIREAK
ncbi:MAG: molybdopterin-dependent oxidoreductase [Hyphomicrobiales bacterium]|nr:molybdopterin-dependent oxidoreductase [Hyphomicrobiales bacterium]